MLHGRAWGTLKIRVWHGRLGGTLKNSGVTWTSREYFEKLGSDMDVYGGTFCFRYMRIESSVFRNVLYIYPHSEIVYTDPRSYKLYIWISKRYLYIYTRLGSSVLQIYENRELCVSTRALYLPSLWNTIYLPSLSKYIYLITSFFFFLRWNLTSKKFHVW